MPISLESDFLRMIEDGKTQRAALHAAIDLVRKFQIGDPDVWRQAAQAMPQLEEVDARAHEIDATQQ